MQKQYTLFILMGLLTGLFTLFGYGQKKQSIAKTNSVDKVPFVIYPKGHKLTGQERKEFTNKFLKQIGVPTLEHLPLVEDFTEAKFRDKNEVAKKAVVLYGLIHVAYREKTSEEMTEYFKKYNLWNTVSPEERDYLVKQNKTEQDNNPITWRIENLNVLLWALSNFDTLGFPTTVCDFSNYKNLPNLEIDPTQWISNSILRDTEDILNETDLIYRIHWATRESNLKGKPMPANIIEDIVMERHFALNWLTMYAENWDDITTDT